MAETGSILERLREAYALRDHELRARFDRSLPFQDAMFDRWERARSLGFGSGTSIYNSALVFGDVRVGEGTWIGPNVMLDGAGGGIRIGSTCSISAGVHVYTHDTIGWALSGGRHGPREGAVRIGDRCYLGSQGVVAAGVEIGTQCVIASNSFVNRDVPDRTIVGGAPARRLGEVVFDGDEPVLRFDSGSETRVVDRPAAEGLPDPSLEP